MGSTGTRAREDFKHVLSSRGETVEIIKKTFGGRDGLGNPLYDYIVQNVETAFIQPVKGDETAVSAGLLTLNDAVGYFSPQSKTAVGYRIRASGELYEAISIEKVKAQGVTAYVKANLKKVVE